MSYRRTKEAMQELSSADFKEQAPSDEAVARIASAARRARAQIGALSGRAKSDLLQAAAEALDEGKSTILEANLRDCAHVRAQGRRPDSFIERMTLDDARVDAMVNAVRSLATFPDPVGVEIARWRAPSGLDIARVRCPIGVIGMIYESRPNVTADASALSLLSGNAVILRGGSECRASNAAIHQAFAVALDAAQVERGAVQFIDSPDRAWVGLMLAGMGGAIDVVIPRGGRRLVERVEREARVPVFSHLEGVCHLYLHEEADRAKACEIIVNAKMRRTSVCGALECLLVDQKALSDLPRIVDALVDSGCTLRGDEATRRVDDRIEAASPDDYGREFGAPILALRAVDGLDEALRHVAEFGSHHTDGILTENEEVAETFLTRVDSAVVIHNGSTQFSDGGEFGFGGEIGIATGRLHARGPIGPEQLTCFKYKVRGRGQVRP